MEAQDGALASNTTLDRGRARFTGTFRLLFATRLAGTLRFAGRRFCTCELPALARSSQVQNGARPAAKPQLGGVPGRAALYL
jgi:hypothetical protein